MQSTMDQKLLDSEESYLNTTFWDIYPLFLQVQNGDEAALRAVLDIRLDLFPAGRITRDARKQYEYLTVSLVNTFMIAAIEGGVYPPEANAIADQALRKLSQIRSVSELPAIVDEAAVHLCQLVSETKRKDTGNAHVESAKHFIATHLTQEISVADIAKAVGVSASHLSHLFQAHTSQSMREYLLQERIAAAKQLLASTDQTISQIASLLSFCDQSYFTLVFRRQTGTTPGEYRRQVRRA